jgi:hypothetical protein
MRNDEISKAIWCRFYIDDFSTAKVKIIHVRGGKYKVIDDREGGQYVGRIVDASDVDHFEIWHPFDRLYYICVNSRGSRITRITLTQDCLILGNLLHTCTELCRFDKKQKTLDTNRNGAQIHNLI